ncbi:MAG: PAS domain S-box protein [Balneolaceae bacterium]
MSEIESLFHTLISSINEGFCIVEVLFDKDDTPVDYRFLETNPSFKKQTGIDADKAKDKTVYELFPEKSRQWFKIFSEVALKGEAIHFEDFSELTNRLYNAYAFRIGAPEKRKVGVIFKDTRENSSSLLNAIIKGSDDAILSKNPEGIITSWNKSAEHIFKYTAQEAIGKSVTMLIPDHRIDEEKTILERVKSGEHVDHFETERLCKDGSLVNISLTISPIRDSTGQIVGSSEIAQNVTERKKNGQEHETLLREIQTERERLADIFQHAPSFMCVLNGPDHIFERANELFFRLMGKRDIIGKPVLKAVPEAAEQGFVDLLDQVYLTGETYTGTSVPIRLHRNSGHKDVPEEKYLNFVYQPIRNSDNIIDGIFVQGVDLTEQKRAEEKLRSLNRTLKEKNGTLLTYQEKLQFLISQLNRAEEQERHRLAAELHDNLGQILTIGKMKIDRLLKNNDVEENGINELSELINQAIRYTRELMSDLKPPPSLQQESLRKTMQWLADKMETYNLEVTIEDDEQIIPLSQEIQTFLTQCVRELLFNVVKHSGVKKAHVILSHQENQVQVTVKDEGGGFVPEEEKPSPGKEGNFGLFNIMERINLLNGSFQIHSAPGEGTTAILKVPLIAKETERYSKAPEMAIPDTEVQANKSISLPAGGQHQSKTDSKIRILLVDDHQMMRVGLRRIIEEQKDLSIIAEASNGAEAVNLALQISPDVLVMDVNMPKMNGIQATKRIVSENSNIRVIGLSLHDNKNVALSMKRAGASSFLTKTEAFETLCATIRREARLNVVPAQ